MPPAGAATAAVRAWEVSDQGEDLLAMLFPHLAGLRVHRVEDTGDAVVIPASCRAQSACARGAGSGRRGSTAGTRGWSLTARPAGGRC